MGLVDHVRPSVPKDIAKELGSAGLTCLLQLMADAYQDLKARQCIRADSSEPSITEEWVVLIEQRWKQAPTVSYIPFHEKQDATKAKPRGRRPTVDFCFRDGFDSRVYFGAECKLLDEGDRKHLRAYLDDTDGIGRFLDGRYSAHSSAGAMVGYVRAGSCDRVAASLGKAIQNLGGRPKLSESRPLSGFDHLYESQHTRTCQVAEFLCYHLLFGFGCSAA